MSQVYQKNSHCSYCGTFFSQDALWPRRCARCGNATYSNPLPVAVVLLPLGEGLRLVRRAQKPQAGRWSLPGGFIETGETWEEAGARELFEEIGFRIDPGGLRLFDTRSAPDGTLPEFQASGETSDAMIATEPQELAFSTHTETAARFWKENADS